MTESDITLIPAWQNRALRYAGALEWILALNTGKDEEQGK